MKKIINKYIELYNSFQVEEMLKLFSDDCIFENISSNSGIIKVNGLTKLKEVVEKSREIFKYRKQEIINIYGCSQYAACEISFEGILRQTNSDHLIKLRGISTFEFEGKKIKRLVDYS